VRCASSNQNFIHDIQAPTDPVIGKVLSFSKVVFSHHIFGREDIVQFWPSLSHSMLTQCSAVEKWPFLPKVLSEGGSELGEKNGA